MVFDSFGLPPGLSSSQELRSACFLMKASLIGNQFEEIDRSSSERSSGDGDESLYATIR